MSKWIPTWSYVPIDYGLDVAVLEDISQRVLIRNNLRGEAIRLRFQNDGGETPLRIEHASVVLVNRVTGRCSQRHDVTIDGETRIVLPPESRPWSDPVALPLTEEDDLLVWLYFKERRRPAPSASPSREKAGRALSIKGISMRLRRWATPSNRSWRRCWPLIPTRTSTRRGSAPSRCWPGTTRS